MTEQSSPLYLIGLLSKIKKKDVYNLNPDIQNLVLTLELYHVKMPTPFVHGKKCSNCDHRMQCKTLRCPRCHKDMRKRKREENSKKEEEKEDENSKKEEECDGECAKSIVGLEYHTLPCKHKFCTNCMGNRVKRRFRTCCLCDLVLIPEDIRSKYLK